MLPGVEIELNEKDDMLEGRIDVADVAQGDRDADFVELLDQFRLGTAG
jgi:hypothetical protein